MSETIDKFRFPKPSRFPFQIIAGPCSAESEEQVVQTALALKAEGIQTFRASLWKPRTRPGGFEGVGDIGIPWLQRVAQETDMQVCTEVANAKHIELMLKAGFNTFWIGARTSSSPFAISEIAEALRGEEVNILVKNPINPDLELWEGALLRLVQAGVKNIGAIHRGFSTYGKGRYRNEPLWQIPIELKRRYPNLTIIGDPSHIAGRRDLIESLSRSALSLDFDGLIIESHLNPDCAWSDSAQQLTPRDLGQLLRSLEKPLAGEQVSEELRHWRQEIDHIDNEILEKLAQRMELSKQIGQYKSEHKICILQPERYRHLMQSLLNQALHLGLDKHIVEDIFSLIHEHSVQLQQEDCRKTNC